MDVKLESIIQDIEAFLQSTYEYSEITVRNLRYDPKYNYLVIHFVQEFDEDFEDPEGWDALMDRLATKYNIRGMGVPCYYYPK